MTNLLWTPIILAFVSVTASAQNDAHPASLSYASTSELAAQLKSSDRQIRKNVVDSLGLVDPVPVSGPGGIGTIYEPCYEEFEKVEIKTATLTKDTESAILIVRSDLCQSMFVVPVIKQQSGWVAYKAISLWAKFSEPSIKVESLVNKGEQEIISSNVTVDEGPGILQRNMTIFKFLHGSLRIVFDQPEYAQVAEPTREGKLPVFFKDVERSEFTFSKNDENMTAVMSVYEKRRIEVEKQSVTVGTNFHVKKSLTIFREYVWDPRLEMFRMFGQSE
jgi:hypothetical protein